MLQAGVAVSGAGRSRLPELQAAVRALSGVGSAAIAWPEPEGPATLRIELDASADRREVTAAVLDTLDRVAGADVSSVRVALPPPPRAPQAGDAGGRPAAGADPGDGRQGTAASATSPGSHGGYAGNGRPAHRPVFEGIIVQRSALDLAVTVTLTLRDRRLTGEAQGLATRQASPRVAAAATLSALGELLPHDVRLQVDWVDVHDAEHRSRPPVVQVAVALLSGAGEQVMIGAALVRGDVRDAAVRATLDAVNRRLAQLASEGSAAPQG